MLSFAGFAMIALFLGLIMTRRLSALVALALIPVLFGLVIDPAGLGEMMREGLVKLAPTGAMLMFGILFFSIMTDAGLFDPLISRVLRVARGDPLKILVGTAVIGTSVALDGDGATTYVICVTALLPIYRAIGLRPQYMATLLLMSIGIMNILPWGGPTARAASAMHVDVADVFVPLIPAMAVGFGYLLIVATLFGLRERRRVGVLSPDREAALEHDMEEAPAYRRPKLMPVNLALTGGLLAGLITGILPLPILFILATALALAINYPTLAEQRERIQAHSYNIVSVVGLIFAAAIFTGVLSGTGMDDAMSQSLLAIMPDSLGPYMAPATALFSAAATYAVTNDAFYFGMLPILASTAEVYGISGVEMARASLIGQPIHLLSPLVASTYLLVNLVGVEYGDNQRASILWVAGLVLAMLAGALAFGIIPLAGAIA
ncbi:citrate:proton symporter [Paracoccus sp. PS-1]|uniref:CitMHS family transporter n=1 Tax=unclassified Paracoccus (in: a-proteobacteria) TaxID=2688777 RepID=UPI00049193E5|nr:MULTISPECIES: citrate:proton symporter [unclassified Paracoccus (in: a-proteobacteria)]MDQ7262637.1 citrate:proton symporter [Paracoccus sp. PS1]UFM66578.1 citrate:proton symporter [Paracoccus sp. MA]